MDYTLLLITVPSIVVYGRERLLLAQNLIQTCFLSIHISTLQFIEAPKSFLAFFGLAIILSMTQIPHAAGIISLNGAMVYLVSNYHKTLTLTSMFFHVLIFYFNTMPNK